MRLFLSIIFVFLYLQTTYAQGVKISGNIKNFEGKKIKIGNYADYVTLTKNELGKQIIQKGTFLFNLNIKTPTQLYIQVEDKSSSFFVEPNISYDIELSYDIEKNKGRAYDKMLNINITAEGESKLNQKIKEFNKEYQDFFSDNYRSFVINEAKESISAFIAETEKKSKYQSPEFLKQYVHYALGNLKDINKENKSNLAAEYLKGQKVLFNHKEYMNFFQQLYQKDFELLMLKKEGVPIKKAIMMDKDLTTTIKLISQEKGFENNSLSELYLIFGLYDTYHQSIIDTESNIAFLGLLSENASTADNRLLASNIVKKLSIYQKGKAAPEFALKDSDGNIKTLNDYKGKLVYLNFWAKWSIPSLREMKLIQKLEKTYGDNVQFVSINLDEDPSINSSEKEKQAYPWDMLYGGDDFELQEKYKVKTVPLYFLIDTEGNLEEIFAPAPIQMDKLFYNRFK